MVIRNGLFFLSIFLLFLSGCQIQPSNLKETLLPTAIEEFPATKTIQAERDSSKLTVTTNISELAEITASKQNNTATQKPKITNATHKEPTSNWQNYPPIDEQIDRIIAQSGGRWHIIFKEVGGEIIYSRLPDQRINIASVVKVPLALLFFEALEQNGIPEEELTEYIQMTGSGGRTFDQLLSAMLVKSEEDATEILYAYTKQSLNIPVQLREWELSGIDLDARRFTALGVASMFERLYMGDFVSPTSRILILDYLSAYTPNDDFRIGSIKDYMPETFKIYNKRGSLLTPYVVADSAILENSDGADFIITIFAFNSEPKTTYEQLDKAIGEISLKLWQFISANY